MALKTFITPKYKILIHLIAVVSSIMSIVVTLESCGIKNEVSPFCRDLIATILFNVTIYFLVFMLFPLLIKNWKMHIAWAIIYLAFYTFTLGWLHAVSESGVTTVNDAFSIIPMRYFDLEFTLRSFMTIIPFGVLAWLYFLFVYDWEKLKTSFFAKNIERTVNIVVVILIIFYVYIMPQGDTTDEVIQVLTFLIFFYTNTFLITPILFKDNKRQKFFLMSLVWFLGNYITFFLIQYYFTESTYKNRFVEIFLAPLHLFRVFILGFVPIYLLSFIYGYVRFKIKNQNKRLEAKETELQLLKSQVNPHFLFNTLNTLYATALEEQALKTAESTAKLANLLRYMQEDINKEFIPLENEIKYVQDYITIQKLRCSVTPKIETKFENIENQVISPGLLIPFVENAFKYGIDPSKPSSLSVSVVCDENTIHFECVNSYDDSFETYYKEQGFGIGIKNAKQRLELVYPKKYQLEVKKENNIFSVKLSIKTN
ncbi:histidine kinase [Flavobacteriaceae bacterium XHP0103]|uniref:sensor histidine kinase n=1 Tax=Marixanthotalea marina TaxID=2844359 RepID=UPI002989D012|nr:histidine kinase [Marixanthotalea marina]MBU3820793.1 histidine kinase [Marixanthotalea marina]